MAGDPSHASEPDMLTVVSIVGSATVSLASSVDSQLAPGNGAVTSPPEPPEVPPPLPFELVLEVPPEPELVPPPLPFAFEFELELEFEFEFEVWLALDAELPSPPPESSPEQP